MNNPDQMPINPIEENNWKRTFKQLNLQWKDSMTKVHGERVRRAVLFFEI
jgi:hypothetical protein